MSAIFHEAVDGLPANVVADDPPLLGNQGLGHLRAHGAKADKCDGSRHGSSRCLTGLTPARVFASVLLRDVGRLKRRVEMCCIAPMGSTRTALARGKMPVQHA